MGDGTEENPFSRDDMLRLIQENGGKAEGLNLSRKVFEQGVNLSGLNLEGIILNKSRFLLNLARASPLRGAELMGTHLERSHLRGAYLEEADLSDAYLGGASLGSAHLERACFMGTHLGSTHLGGAHLQGAFLLGAEFSDDTGLEDVNWGNYVLGDETMGFDGATASYRQLKTWYTKAGMYSIAGKFFYKEMEARRKSRRWKTEAHLKLWDWILRLLCGYGEKPARVAISALVLVFGLTGVYLIAGAFSPATFNGCLYYSVVSFTALGYANWVHPEPASWAKGLGGAEAALGVFMMALFLVTFTRKMTR